MHVSLSLASHPRRYEYVNGKLHRMGPNMWLLVAICLLEWLLIIKMALSIEQVRWPCCLCSVT